MRLKLIVSYEGTAFSGWQSQRQGNTVQDLIEKAFFQIVGKRIILYGAGRTDTGVHALGQCAHVDIPSTHLKIEDWHRALNAHLPHEIRILKVTPISADFHAQFSSIGKIYRYRIWNAEVMPPLERHRAWHVRNPLNIQQICTSAAFFEGKHNFSSFSARRGKIPCNPIRTIKRIQITRPHRQEIRLTFEGEGFLYKMIRMLTAALVRVGEGKEDTTWIPHLLNSPTEFNKTQHVAPAQGLYLVRVLY